MVNTNVNIVDRSDFYNVLRYMFMSNEDKRTIQMNGGFVYDSSVPSAANLRFSRSSELRRGQ